MTDEANNICLSIYSAKDTQLNVLKSSEMKFDVILLTPKFSPNDKAIPFRLEKKEDEEYLSLVYQWLDEAQKHLKKNGAILVYSIPRWLPFFAEYLSKKMTFKYWIAIKNPDSQLTTESYPPLHEGVILFVMNKNKFTINKVRYPHIFCSQCGDYLADWGGKKHLRHKYGPVISDVWDDRSDLISNRQNLSSFAVDRLLKLTCKNGDSVLLAMGDHTMDGMIPIPETRGLNGSIQNEHINVKKQTNNNLIQIESTQSIINFRRNEIVIGDCIEVMSSWIKCEQPRFDLIFADPPYNLTKNYGNSEDDLSESEYIEWCNKWLWLSSKLLKPNGTLYVLNLPKWSIFHATLLSKLLYFQRWIVWDALSDPRGNIMPAHYSLLVYTKHPHNFTYNQLDLIPTMDQCFRAKCIAQRSNKAPKENISDIWYDVHRIKHKKDRDEHPCQLPLKLLERILLISTEPGDLILDPFMGTGTTALMAQKLGRNFSGIDIDPQYRDIAMGKINNGVVSEILSKDRNTEHQKKLFQDQPSLFNNDCRNNIT